MLLLDGYRVVWDVSGGKSCGGRSRAKPYALCLPPILRLRRILKNSTAPWILWAPSSRRRAPTRPPQQQQQQPAHRLVLWRVAAVAVTMSAAETQYADGLHTDSIPCAILTCVLYSATDHHVRADAAQTTATTTTSVTDHAHHSVDTARETTASTATAATHHQDRQTADTSPETVTEDHHAASKTANTPRRT